MQVKKFKRERQSEETNKNTSNFVDGKITVFCAKNRACVHKQVFHTIYEYKALWVISKFYESTHFPV